MKILWFGVFDGIEYRSEYPMVRGIEKCGGQVIQCNYRGETYTSIEDAVTQEHSKRCRIQTRLDGNINKTCGVFCL